MQFRETVLVASFLLMFPLSPLAQHLSQGELSKTPYAGLQTREIKSLSERDISELKRGAGWGLALPAELNGWPGPVHVLELKEDLNLSGEQIEKLHEIYEGMQAKAIEIGARLIESERALDKSFAGERLGEKKLRALLRDASQAREDLRYVHLSRHLMTADLLSSDQIQEYAVLRGYREHSCDSAPKGHDEEMWRRHNGCE